MPSRTGAKVSAWADRIHEAASGGLAWLVAGYGRLWALAGLFGALLSTLLAQVLFLPKREDRALVGTVGARFHGLAQRVTGGQRGHAGQEVIHLGPDQQEPVPELPGLGLPPGLRSGGDDVVTGGRA